MLILEGAIATDTLMLWKLFNDNGGTVLQQIMRDMQMYRAATRKPAVQHVSCTSGVSTVQKQRHHAVLKTIDPTTAAVRKAVCSLQALQYTQIQQRASAGAVLYR